MCLASGIAELDVSTKGRVCQDVVTCLGQSGATWMACTYAPDWSGACLGQSGAT